MEHDCFSPSLFRVIDPAYGRDNIYRYAARKTVSLGPVMVATAASNALPWLDAEVLSENNYRKGRKGPFDSEGRPDHRVLQEERYAEWVGLSASISNAAPRAIEIIRTYRALPEGLRPKGIVVGGWHAGDCPEEFLEAGADVVVHGEAAEMIPSLIHALRAGTDLREIPGISYWRDGAIHRNGPDFLTLSQDAFEALPDPNFDLVRYAQLSIIPVSRTWGCSGKCRFCRVKQAPRALPPERFARQIKTLVSKGYQRFFLVDDRAEEDLEGFRAWLRELAAFRRDRRVRRLDFTVQARLSLARKPEVLRLMRLAGVNTVCIGFESPIPEDLRAMRKPIAPEKMVEWTRIWRGFGFFVHAMMIFAYPMPPGMPQPVNKDGRPLSAKERADAYGRFLRAAKPDTLQVLVFTPIPGTEDWEDLDRQGRIYNNLGWAAWDGLHVVSEPDPGLSPEDVQYELIRIHRKFYTFRFFGGGGLPALAMHVLKVGITTVSMPFLWVTILPWKWSPGRSFARQAALAWRCPSRWARNARRRFQAFLIVQRVQRQLENFRQRLRALIAQR